MLVLFLIIIYYYFLVDLVDIKTKPSSQAQYLLQLLLGCAESTCLLYLQKDISKYIILEIEAQSYQRISKNIYNHDDVSYKPPGCFDCCDCTILCDCKSCSKYCACEEGFVLISTRSTRK